MKDLTLWIVVALWSLTVWCVSIEYRIEALEQAARAQALIQQAQVQLRP